MRRFLVMRGVMGTSLCWRKQRKAAGAGATGVRNILPNEVTPRRAISDVVVSSGDQTRLRARSTSVLPVTSTCGHRPGYLTRPQFLTVVLPRSGMKGSLPAVGQALPGGIGHPQGSSEGFQR